MTVLSAGPIVMSIAARSETRGDVVATHVGHHAEVMEVMRAAMPAAALPPRLFRLREERAIYPPPTAHVRSRTAVERHPVAEGVEAVPVDALAEPGALFTAPRA